MYEDHFQLVNGLSVGKEFNSIVMHTDTPEKAKEVFTDLKGSQLILGTSLHIKNNTIIFNMTATNMTATNMTEDVKTIITALKMADQASPLVELRDNNMRVAVSSIIRDDLYKEPKDKFFGATGATVYAPGTFKTQEKHHLLGFGH